MLRLDAATIVLDWQSRGVGRDMDDIFKRRQRQFSQP